MWWLIWMAGLSVLAFAMWCVAAFALRLRHLGRLIVTVAGPGIGVGCYCWLSYLERAVNGGPGWDAVFLVLSILAGGLATLAVLPIWFVAEEKLGWRAR